MKAAYEKKLKKSDTVYMSYSSAGSTFDFGMDMEYSFKPLKRTTKTSYSIKKEPGYKYVFKVRSYKTVGKTTYYSAWSTPKSVTVSK